MVDLKVELLRVEEVAELLQVGRTKVFELLREDDFPVIRIGRSVRVPRRGLMEWIAARTEHDLKASA